MSARRLLLILVVLGGCAHLNRADPASRAVRLGGQAQARAAATGELRLVTYNIHGDTAGVLYRAIRADPRLARADVIFAQEIEIDSEDTPARLAALLGWDYAYAPGYGIGAHGSHGVAILSRLALRDPAVIELPRYQVVFNSARRVALAATIDVAGRSVRLYNVHLDNRINPADRRAQLAPVLADAARHPAVPAVVAGDMNTSPFCWIDHVVPVPCGLQDDRLERAVRASGFTTPVVESGPTHKWLSMRLDAIYTRHVAVVHAGVARTVRVSDHLPLWADLRVWPGPLVSALRN